MSKAQEIIDAIYDVNENFIDKFFAKFQYIINHEFKNDAELTDELIKFLQDEYGLRNVIIKRRENRYDAEYRFEASLLTVFAPDLEIKDDYTDVFHILIAILHELSHHQLLRDRPNMIKRYKVVNKKRFHTITDYVFQSIERSAFAVSVAFEMYDHNLRFSQLVSIADELKDKSDDELIDYVEKRFSIKFKDSDIGFVLYALSRSKRKDRKKLRFLKLVKKTSQKVSGYMGRHGAYAVRKVREHCILW